MPFPGQGLVRSLTRIHAAAAESDDGRRCMVSPAPELQEAIVRELESAAERVTSLPIGRVMAAEPDRPGFNDGLIVPGKYFGLGTSPSAIRAAAADRAPLRGIVRVIVVLVDFTDQPMDAGATARFNELFFSSGTHATGSVRDYFADVSNGLIDIQGEVVGPYRLPQTLAAYAHGESGMGNAQPNARTMARDAAIAANPDIDFAPYDNDGNGYVDAFVVVHAGPGAEQTGDAGQIWSHKWVLPSEYQADGSKIFAYLTIPEDARLGVSAHELGHLVFGWPDLYDTDYTSNGIGRWCLMAGGSWNDGGDTPAHPSAWCKVNQGWVTTVNQSSNAVVTIADVKTSRKVFRLWKDGGASQEYFLVENRQQDGFDAHLPGAGLLVWHIDEATQNNTNETHYKVALEQADGQKHLETRANSGDAGDPFPGTSDKREFTRTTTPGSLSYGSVSTCVAVTEISDPGPSMSARLQVRCQTLKLKDVRDTKGRRKDKLEKFEKFEKLEKNEKREFEKPVDKFPQDKRPEKPITDKLDKPFDDPGDWRRGGFGSAGGGQAELDALAERVAALEAALGGGQPFIEQELRPDLAEAAFLGEEDVAGTGSRDIEDVMEKRLLDTPPPA